MAHQIIVARDRIKTPDFELVNAQSDFAAIEKKLGLATICETCE